MAIILFYRCFEDAVNAAQRSIDKYEYYHSESYPFTWSKRRDWLQKILDILKLKNMPLFKQTTVNWLMLFA